MVDLPTTLHIDRPDAPHFEWKSFCGLRRRVDADFSSWNSLTWFEFTQGDEPIQGERWCKKCVGHPLVTLAILNREL